MFVLPIETNNIKAEIDKINVHTGGKAIMLGKGEIIPLKLYAVRTPAANIIKQEMLAAGGECVVHGDSITCKIQSSDILLLGTRKHYKILLYKLKFMNYFGLARVAAAVDGYLKGLAPYTLLADGRKLEYHGSRVMGIINTTPDSFNADSRKTDPEQILSTVAAMHQAGATIIDIGGESTGPGATPVDAAEELQRVVPAIKAIRAKYGHELLISIDTYRANTAKAALAAGADIVNDVSACVDPEMLQVLLDSGAPIVLMHSEPLQTDDCVQEVAAFLYNKAKTLEAAGINKDKIIIDIGIGFNKDQTQNLILLKYLRSFQGLGYPVLLGASRKRVVGYALDLPQAQDRISGTLAITAHAQRAGTQIIRVHDVLENIQIIKMLEAINNV